jgi:hypothetical protein
VGAGVGLGAQVIIPGLVILVMLVALLIQVFRLLYGLLFSYVQLLLFSLGGPILILIGSIPGRGGTTSFWLRGLMGNALVFPAVFAVLLFAGLILGTAGNDFQSSLPLFGGIADPNFMKVLIAYTLILGSPAVPNMIRGFFKVQFPPAIGQAAMAGVTAGVAPFRQSTTRALKPFKQENAAYNEATLRARMTAGAPPAVDNRRAPWLGI